MSHSLLTLHQNIKMTEEQNDHPRMT